MGGGTTPPWGFFSSCIYSFLLLQTVSDLASALEDAIADRGASACARASRAAAEEELEALQEEHDELLMCLAEQDQIAQELQEEVHRLSIEPGGLTPVAATPLTASISS